MTCWSRIGFSEIECLATYENHLPNEPLDGAVFSPFVELNIRGGFFYTVGNESSFNEPHKTVIKSFQYGFGVASSGVGAKIELVSEGGNAYIEFAKAINKTINRAAEDTDITYFRYGWIIKKCDGSREIKSSPIIHLMIKTMQTSYEEGTIKISIECVDLMSRHFERRIEGNFGSDENKMPIKEAINSLFEENDPVLNVRYEPPEFGWKHGDRENGPRAKWPGDQQNSLSVTRKWLSGQVTENDKGMIIQYDPTEPALVITEDPKPGKNEKTDPFARWIGTYVVNGGNCSDVLSFTPTVDWILFGNNAGGTAGSSDVGANDQKAKPDIDIENAGPQENTTNQHQDKDWAPTNDLPRINQEAAAAQTRANKDYEIKPGCEAELKIFGNPNKEFANPVLLAGATVSIVMINPYTLENCTWISNPKCNEVLSNKRWLVLGIDHQIESGQYNTTLKIKLDIPNADLDQGTTMGGEGAGTLAFDNDSGKPLEST
jgi:hypothetical protein